ncbi:DNA polymerase I, partial [Patescibacteria group bacterium]|nr:DNA polymerase I [Patescibacteria group bacterium]
MKKKKLVLIDGHAIIHRAFHAIPSLTTPKGELVNGVYGFSLILLNVLKKIKPTHLVVALDVGGETVRHREYKEYKAHRVKAPEELHNQVPRIKEVLAAFNIPVFLKKGYEADDIIGTLSCQAEKYKNLETIIVTGDLDTLQLVSPQTKVFTMRRGLTDTIIYDEKSVQERFGFGPEKMVDFKGLAGDPSDNIPGVKGIGEKTATDLIKKYRSIEEIYKALGAAKLNISPRYQEILLEQKDEAFLSKKLATILVDLDVSLDLKKAELHDYERTKVLKLFQELGFRSLISKLPLAKKDRESGQESLFGSESAQKTEKQGNYYLVDNRQKFENLYKKIKLAKYFVFDTETDTLGGKLIGISFSFKEKEAYYLSLLNKESNYYLKKLKPIFESNIYKKIGHNLKYDCLILSKNKIRVSGLKFDTMLAAYILHPGKRNYSLESLAFIDLGLEKTAIEELIGRKGEKKLDRAPLKAVSNYSCEDADLTLRLYNLYRPRLKKRLKKIFYSLEMPLIIVLSQMEENGIKLDSQFLKKMSRKISQEINLLKEKIYKLAGSRFNINSTQQLRQVLFEKLKIAALEVKKTKTGLSTAASELEKIRERHKIIDLIVKYREITKLKNTYLDALPKLVASDGRIHTSFNQTITATGRLSSSNPNLQNIPIRTELGNKIRQAFIVERGSKLLAFDYSQIELRVVAHLAGDSKMISAFKKGEDIHAATASWLFNKPIKKITKFERREAKTVNFGVLYGISSYGLSQGAKMERAEAAEFIDNYFKTFKGVKKYLDETKEMAKRLGYVETIFGRRRYIPEINSNVYDIAMAAERMAINMPVQGTAADIIKL